MRNAALLVLLYLLVLLPLLANAFRLPSTSSSLLPRAASPNDEDSNPPPTLVDRLFSLFFGAKEAKPLGFDRISVEKSPVGLGARGRVGVGEGGCWCVCAR